MGVFRMDLTGRGWQRWWGVVTIRVGGSLQARGVFEGEVSSLAQPV